jgi:hypothetical protein
MVCSGCSLLALLLKEDMGFTTLGGVVIATILIAIISAASLWLAAVRTRELVEA